ncbi:16S rRNA (uracil(1498)-N(3))-methyltransferase [Brevundimonas goettingensis]|uniref:Ribosomal RNA small subunit methyltransferase E n=1 Tax=Brevundimonas goettingensis TaxID=2774190 RepID=A0A975C086_9CAUL|nr:16S rRNA (uracil(1498)-N(3))-methyltransferase [Brevundimonas goettingensis]QTC91306.1 16S rRNA (uracil(1498)-N(3))-methyltransferase [Brevundimonas goettingensis]
MIRLHVTSDLSANAAVAPTLDQSRYLTNVMRLSRGDELLVFNGRDGEWRASVAETHKRGVILKCEERARAQTVTPDLELIVAMVKKARVETIVEKAAELGAARVRLTVTRRTNVDRVRLDRLDAIAEEAAEQTGRLDVPPVDDPMKLEAILDGWDPARKLMFCDETGGAPAIPALTAAGPGPWAILIGPEGGFSPEEGERLRSLPFTTAVSLGPRILRADTAAIAAMTLWQAAVGDWER